MSNDSQPYTFLPFIQRGLATYIEREDHLGEGDTEGPEQRAQLSASVKLGADSNNANDQLIEKTIGLKGPGDITGMNPKIISRTEPAGNEDRFFPNYLPFVDFMDEDFPWRYSPAIPAGSDPNRKLRPWLFLVVLKPDEFSYTSYPDSPNDVIQIESSLSHDEVFPPPDQIWAWAHVQLNTKKIKLDDGSEVTLDGDATGGITEQERKALLDFLDRNPEKVISRILCPRKLEPNQPYYGFLIPSFEMGRQAGLGKSLADTDLDVQQPAWSNGTNTDDDRQDYPVYYSWQFTTSSQGDFEDLADEISPFQPASDTDLGRIPLDISEPDHPDLDHKADQEEIEMGGALRVANQNFEPIPDPSETGNTFYYNLRRLVNLADEFDRTSYDPVHDPIIYIPFYGRWHAGRGRVTDTSDWLGELNIDPRHRVAAGIGAKIVRENQEQYMAEAWQQVGQIREANETINFARFSYAGVRYDFEKYYKIVGAREKLTMSISNTVKVINANTGNIVWQDIKGSRMPENMFDYGFTKAIRPGSTISRTFEVSNPPEIADRVANGDISVEPADQLGAGRQLAVNNIVSDSDLSATTINNTSEKSDFVLTKAGTNISQWTTGTDSAIGADTRLALEDTLQTLDTFEYQAEPQYVDVTATELAGEMEDFLDPGQNFSDLAGRQITVDGININLDIRSEPPIMAAPVLDKPMYKALKNLSLDYLIPNFHLIPENSTTLLELNRPFIEAYFAGLNHEFAQELLWNEYPTDQRGSYFRRFWENNVPFTKPGESASTDQEQEAEQARDITPMHEWDLSTKLGPHNPKNESGDGPMLVLVVKADLVEKFPSLNIYAHKARWVEANTDDDEDFDEINWYTTEEEYRKEMLPDDPANKAHPQFFGKVNPDTYLVGFDLTAEEAMATEQPEEFESGLETDLDAGWFFVLQERPGDVRFGADVPESDTGLDGKYVDPNTGEINLDTWKDLNWGHIADQLGIDNLSNLNFIDLNVIGGSINSGLSIDPSWNKIKNNNSANMASIFYQPHNRVVIHADQMIK